MASQHPYQPLNPDKPEIRLVILAPGSGTDEIRCDLQHVSLDDNPKYSAVSYCWGDGSDVWPITLDDRVFQVTANLHAALRQFRHEAVEVPLWVDAICINQNDVRERSEEHTSELQ